MFASDAATQSSSSSSSSSTTTPTTKHTPNESGSSSSLETFAIALPDLSTLSIDDLVKLNDDPTHLFDFVEELDMLQGFHKQLDDLIDDVESITGKTFKLKEFFLLN